MKKLIILICLISSNLFATEITPELLSFNAGELSPAMRMRSDYNKYNNACQELENMLLLSQGPATRRPGTKYVTGYEVIVGSRLIPFEYAKTDAYVLLFEDSSISFFRNNGQVLDAGEEVYTVETDYDEDEIWDIQYAQNANVMFLVDGNHTPQKLTRNDHADWVMADVNIVAGPFLPENTTTTTIEPNATTGTITLIASANIFDGNHVGSLWRLGHRKESTSIHGKFDANGTSDEISCSGGFDYNVRDKWEGTVTLERSFDSGDTWEAVYARYNHYDSTNTDYSDTETEDGVIYRVTMTGYVRGKAVYDFSVHTYTDYGIVRILDYIDANEVTATVLSELTDTTATEKWSEGYWSDYRGWPQTIAFHEQRLIYGGSRSYPQTIWTSKTASGEENDYENMTACTNDDAAMIYSLPGQNPIQWMLSQTYLLVGTLSGTGRWGSDSDSEPITPTQPTNYREQARNGAAYMQALLVGDSVLYVERGGLRVRELVYDVVRERFIAPDLTILAEHITGTGIKQIAYQSKPDIILWCVRNDGDIATLTYERNQDVVGWTRITTDGDFKSVAVVPDTEGGEDKVWVIVERGETDYIEQFQPRDWGTDQTDCFFVDSGLTFDGGDAVNITNVSKADPAVVTVSTWPTDGDGDDLADGDQIKIVSVSGMTELNGNIYTIDDDNVGGKTFTLDDSNGESDINSVGYTTYTSGGTVQRFERDFYLEHLDGKTVAVLADGNALGTEVVTGAAVAIDAWANKVHIGLPYTSQLETMPFVISGQQGISAGRRSKISSVFFNFYETLGVEYGTDANNLDDVIFPDLDDDPIPLFTGWLHCSFLRGYYRDATIYMQTDEPLPFTIRAIIPKLEVIE